MDHDNGLLSSFFPLTTPESDSINPIEIHQVSSIFGSA